MGDSTSRTAGRLRSSGEGPRHARLRHHQIPEDFISHIRRVDHGGITVADLDMVTAFFVGLGLEVEGRTFVEGEFVDTVLRGRGRSRRPNVREIRAKHVSGHGVGDARRGIRAGVVRIEGQRSADACRVLNAAGRLQLR